MQLAGEKYTEISAPGHSDHFEIDRLCGAAAPFVEPAATVWPAGVPSDLADTFAFHLARHEVYIVFSVGGTDLERQAVDAVLYAHASIGVPCQRWRAERSGRSMVDWTTDPAHEARIRVILATQPRWPQSVAARCWHALVRAAVPVYAREGGSYKEIASRVCGLAPVPVLYGHHLGCSRSTVATVLREAGLTRARRRWTDAERRIVEETIGDNQRSRTQHYEALAAKLDRTPGGGPIDRPAHGCEVVKFTFLNHRRNGTETGMQSMPVSVPFLVRHAERRDWGLGLRPITLRTLCARVRT